MELMPAACSYEARWLGILSTVACATDYKTMEMVPLRIIVQPYLAEKDIDLSR